MLPLKPTPGILVRQCMSFNPKCEEIADEKQGHGTSRPRTFQQDPQLQPKEPKVGEP
jgi:hypothetical protein